MMPHLGGREVAEVLSVFHPQLPVLAMSGAALRLEPDRRLPVLAKPFAVHELIGVASEMLRRVPSVRPGAEEKRTRARELRRAATLLQVRGSGSETVDLVALAHELRRAGTGR
jgi:hypothetical protein